MTPTTRHASSPFQSLVNIRPFGERTPYVPRVIFVSHQKEDETTNQAQHNKNPRDNKT